MRYWLITSEYPPFSGGGISTYSWQTAKMLNSFDVNITVFIPDSNISKVTEKESEGIRTIHCPVGNQKENQILGWETAMSFSIAKIVKEYLKKEGDPDILESQEYSGIAYYTYQIKYIEKEYLKNTLLVTTTHAPSFLYLEANEAPLYKFPEYWVGEMERATLRMSDIIISPSRFLLDKINKEVNISNISQHVLLNPYEHSNEKSLDFIPGEICFFGKLTPQKGCIEMLNYFDKMWQNNNQVKLRIIGGEDHFFYPKMIDMGKFLRQKYKNYIDDRRLIMEGHTPPERLQEMLKSAQVVLIPSRIDNLPYTVIESMSMGKVVLASTDGGQAEIIDDGRNGFLFDHHKENDFINKLNLILNLSPEQHEKISSIAISSIAETFNYQSIWEKKKNLLEESRKNFVRSEIFPFIRDVKKTHVEVPPDGKLLSVIIPYYNMGEYIDDCINSIENSSYSHIEILIIDDGSTDTFSKNKLEEIASAGRARVYRKPNTGLCETRNFGAQKANGDYIAFLDADDQVESSYYIKAMNLLKEYRNIFFVGCWAQYFGRDNEVWPSFNPEFPYLLVHNMINSSALIYKKKAFLMGGLNDPKMYYGMEDYESVIQMVKNGYRGIVIPEVLWFYRIRSGSMAQSFNQFSQIFLYRTITEKHSDLYSTFSKDVVNLLNANGPGYKYDNPTKNTLLSNRLVIWVKKNYILRKFAKLIYSRFYR